MRTVEERGLSAVRVETAREALLLSVIRNECREGFAHFNGEISPEQQARWWAENRERVRAWVYWRGSLIVGYGLARRDEQGLWWTSVAVLPQFAGQGYGGAITHDLVERMAPETVYGEARRDNPAAVRLHHERDWEEVESPDLRLRRFRSRARIPTEALAEWAQEGWAVT